MFFLRAVIRVRTRLEVPSTRLMFVHLRRGHLMRRQILTDLNLLLLVRVALFIVIARDRSETFTVGRRIRLCCALSD